MPSGLNYYEIYACMLQAKIKELQEVVDFERQGRLRVSVTAAVSCMRVCCMTEPRCIVLRALSITFCKDLVHADLMH